MVYYSPIMARAEVPGRPENSQGKVAGFFRNSAEYLRKNWQEVLLISAGGLATLGLGCLTYLSMESNFKALSLLPWPVKALPVVFVAVPAVLTFGALALAYIAIKRKS